MSKDSFLIHLRRDYDKIDKMINSLNKKAIAPRINEGDKASVNMMEFCWFHNYRLDQIAELMGKKIA